MRRQTAALLITAGSILFSGILIAGVQPVAEVPNSIATPAGGGGDSFDAVLSADGRYVLFSSFAGNLTINNDSLAPAGPTGLILNAYLRDRYTQTTSLVSVAPEGYHGGNADSFPDAISTNGQFILFESTAVNLVTNTTGLPYSVTQIYMHDLINGTTWLISAASNGVPGNGNSGNAVMTPDGRYVAYSSLASNLVAGDTNGISDVFLFDNQTKKTTLVSVGASSSFYSPLSTKTDLPVLSADGRYVAFFSLAAGLVSGVGANGDIFLRDTVSNTTTWVSAYAHTILTNIHPASNVLSTDFVMSPDGQHIAYVASPANGGVAQGLGGGMVFRYNTGTGLTDFINANGQGILAGTETAARTLDMTPDGRFVAFLANVNFGAPAGKFTNCIKLWDAQTSNSIFASTDTNHLIPAVAEFSWPAIDNTGRYVSFLARTALQTNSPGSTGINLFRIDTQSGISSVVDVSGFGSNTPTVLNTYPRMSADGSVVVFESLGEGLVGNDNNHVYNVFAHDFRSNTIELISAATPSATPLTADGMNSISNVCVSSNDRYVVFVSQADNLVPGDTNQFQDVFVRDILTGFNYLVSANAAGTGSANGWSSEPSISGDGRFVAFTSTALNLTTNLFSPATNVFVRDLQSNTTTLVSANYHGDGFTDGPSYSSSISSDGRYVLFRSQAENLVQSVSYSGENIYWRDLKSGTTFALTSNFTSSYYPDAAMTPDGQRVAVTARNGNDFLYVWDAPTKKYIYTNSTTAITGLAISPTGTRVGMYTTNHTYAIDISSNSPIAIATNPITTTHPTMQFSGDGRYLVYMTAVHSIFHYNQIYLYDYTTRLNTRVSTGYLGDEGNLPSDSPAISSDGNFIAYRSQASNIVTNDTNHCADIFFYLPLLHKNILVTADYKTAGSANGASSMPVFSSGGSVLVFQSWATDLASNDFNGTGDIFAYLPYFILPKNGFAAVTNFNLDHTTWSLSSPIVPSFMWLTAPGANYEVLFKDNLDAPAWQVLTNNISIVGGVGYATDLHATNSQRFYRVVGAQ